MAAPISPPSFRNPPLPEDPTSGQTAEQLPTYNAYSIDGDVTAPLVYVNYGMPEDYEVAGASGISVKGAIVIARYGHTWRGIKPQGGARSMARWDASCIPIRAMMAIGGRDVSRKGRGGRRMAYSVAACRTAPCILGDPLTPGVRRNRGRQACAAQRGPNADQNSGSAHLLRRCATAAGRYGWRRGARGLAWRPAHYLPLRSWSGQSASKGRIRTGT